jgi:hypothetical protein
MGTRKWLLLLALIVLAGGGYLVYRLTRPVLSDTDQIKHAIVDATQSLEQRRVQSFMRIIADDYNDGANTRQDIENDVRDAVLGTDRIRVVPYLRSLAVQGTTAQTVVEADVTADETRPGASSSTPFRGRYTINLTWRKGPRGWQITSATGWEGAQGGIDE